MSANQKFYWLMAGVLSLLIAATSIGAVLGLRVRTDSGRAVVENLNSRTRAR